VLQAAALPEGAEDPAEAEPWKDIFSDFAQRTLRYAIEACINIKEPWIVIKEPCIKIKEPCITIKEPWINVKEPGINIIKEPLLI